MKKMINKLLKQENLLLITQSKIKKDFPTIEDMMFGNKSAQRINKKKKNYKNKPK